MLIFDAKIKSLSFSIDAVENKKSKIIIFIIEFHFIHTQGLIKNPV